MIPPAFPRSAAPWCVLALAVMAGLAQAREPGCNVPLEQRFAPAVKTSEIPEFRRHVLPLMGRLGCNGRACHGSFQGQGGFRLSLFGYDFTADHSALLGPIAAHGGKPRADVKHPRHSLVLLKPTEQVDHGGGERFKTDSWAYRVLLRWIESGAAGVSPNSADFERLEVQPAELLFRRPEEKVQLRVVAHWRDGSREDVTCITRFRSNDESIAKVDENGLVTCLGKGDTHVVAFYDNGVQPVPVMLPMTKDAGVKYPSVAAPTEIDRLVMAKLRKLGIVPSALCTDAEFLRRASLDTTGTLPRGEEVAAFLRDNAPNKRERKIDELLSRASYAAWWTTRLCDFTGNNPRSLNMYRDGGQVTREWYSWIYERVAKNVAYDKIVEGILLATSRRTGQSYRDFCAETTDYYAPQPIGSFAHRETMPHFWERLDLRDQPDVMALSVSHAFLGVQLQCAQCHKHPFDRWTKQDFEQFANCFKRVSFGISVEDQDEFEQLRSELPEGTELNNANNFKRIQPALIKDGAILPLHEVYILTPGTAPGNFLKKSTSELRLSAGKKKDVTLVLKPVISLAPLHQFGRMLGGQEIELTRYADPRQPIMDWMRSEPQHLMARAFVNRVWAGYFNVGIVQPPDDMNLANPPSNGPLLDYLSSQFIRRGYDMKWLHREILSSQTYQRSYHPNETNALDDHNFSHAIPRRLPAEVAYDTLVRATATETELAQADRHPEDRLIGMGAVPLDTSGADKGFSNYVLKLFGRPDRMSNCDCERSSEPSLLQTVFLRNDAVVFGLIDRKDGWLDQADERLARLSEKPRRAPAKQVAAQVLPISLNVSAEAEESKKVKLSGVPVAGQFNNQTKAAELSRDRLDALVVQLYLRTLSRYPQPAELGAARKHLLKSSNMTTGLRDVLWALVNTKEFIVNH